MTPAELKAWQDQHGGLAGQEGPDANGITVYRARDGSFVNVRADGSLAMRGKGSPAQDYVPGQTAPPAVQPSAGVGQTTQQQLEARIARNPRLVYQGQTLKTKPSGATEYGAPKTVQVPVVTWIDPSTGETVEAEIGSGGGTYTVVQDGLVEGNKGKDEKPQQPREAPGGAAWKDDGPEAGATGRRWGWNPATGLYDRDLGPSPAAQGIGKTQPASKQEAVPGYPGWTSRTDKDAQGNELTVYYGPGSTTPQRALPEKPEAPTKPTYQTIKGGDGQEYVRSITIGADGKPVIQTYGPNGQPVAAIPGEKQEPKLSQTRSDVDGQVYTTVTTISPDNKITVQTVDQQGHPVDRIPMKADKPDKTEIREINGELREIIRNPDGTVKETRPVEKPTPGAGAGPPLPQLVVGMSQAALRGYKEQLQAEVAAGRQTQTWANARWAEATQMATFAVQEATLQQREYETNLNANVNLAQSRLSYLSTGMGQALNFALSINDKLPPGSDLGGKAFAAILGLQSINMARSGINDIKTSPTDTRSIIERSRASSGLDAPPAPSSVATLRIANPGNPQAVEQQRQAVVGQLQEHVDGISNTTDAGGAPREYTPASSTVGSGQPPAAAPVSPPSLFAGPGGTPAVDTGAVGISPDGSTAVAPDGSTAPVDTNRPLPTAPTATPPQFTDPQTGQFGIPGSFITGPTQAPADAPTPVGMGAPSAAPEIAALATYRQPQQEAPMSTPPQAPPPMQIPEQPQIQVPEQPPMQVDPSGGGMPLALLKQRLASTPPWRLSSSDFALAQQYGLEEDAWKTPTRVGMAV